MPQRWKGALSVCDPSAGRLFFLDLTPLAGVSIDQQMGDKDLRGCLIIAQREGNSKRSPLSINFVGKVENPEALPSEADPLITLRKVWGIADL